MKNKEMWKNFIILALILIIFVILAFTNRLYSELNNASSNESSLESVKPLGKIYRPTTLSEINNILESNETKMVVIGRTGCEFCQKYLPELNELIKEKKVDIYYIDIAYLSKDDYNTFLLNSGLTIPSKCTDSKTEEPISNGFGTPLTLFVSNHKSVDCIRGYTTKEIVLESIERNNVK